MLHAVTPSTNAPENVPVPSLADISAPSRRFRETVSHVAPICAFSSMETTHPHMYTHVAGIMTHDAIHESPPMLSAATALTPGTQVTTYTSADAMAATFALENKVVRQKQNATSWQVHSARNANVRVQSVYLNGYIPTSETSKLTSTRLA